MDDGRPPTKRAREEERIGVCAKILGSFGYSAKSRSQQNMAPAALETKGSTRVDNSINVVVITNGRHEKKKERKQRPGKRKSIGKKFDAKRVSSPLLKRRRYTKYTQLKRNGKMQQRDYSRGCCKPVAYFFFLFPHFALSTGFSALAPSDHRVIEPCRSIGLHSDPSPFSSSLFKVDGPRLVCFHDFLFLFRYRWRGVMHSRLFMPKTARRTTIPSRRGENNKGSGLWLKKKKRNNNNKRSKRQNGDESDLFATDEELLDVSLAQFLFAVDLLDRQTGQRIWPSWQRLALRLQSCFP